ncbi:hypothetical protein TNIN_481001, partial [Trichonephila inaurata madagascariensis]
SVEQMSLGEVDDFLVTTFSCLLTKVLFST